MIGDAPGNALFFTEDHVFQTALDGIEDSYDILLDAIPQFVLPVAMDRGGPSGFVPAGAAGGSPGSSSPSARVTPAPVPEWMKDGEFAIQVFMWNPQVFPALPEQYPVALYVSIQPDGTVLSVPCGGSLGGLAVWHELGTNSAGQKVIRFPFSIAGYDP